MATLATICPDSSLLPVDNGIVPLCFLDIIGYGISTLFLIIFGGIRLRSVMKTQPSELSMTSKLHRTKVVLSVLAAFLPLARSAYKIFSKTGHMYQIISDFYFSVSWVIGMFLVIFEFSRAQRNSWVIRTWWTIIFILTTFLFQTEIRLAEKRQNYYTIDLLYAILEFLISLIMATIGLFFNRIPEAYERLAEGAIPDTANDEPTLALASDTNIIMEINKKGDPETRANIFSKLAYSWLNPLLLTGYKRPLEMSDLYEIPARYHSAEVSNRFGRIWDEEKTRPKPSLARAFRKYFGWRFALSGLLKLAQDASMFAAPIFLQQIIAYVGSTGGSEWTGYLYVLGMFSTNLLQSVFVHQYFFLTFNIGLLARSAVITAIYKKAFYLSNKSRQQKTVGEIVNLQAIDSQKLQDLFPYLHMMWSAPEQIIVSIFMLWRLVGPSALAGLGVLILTAPLNGILAKKLGKYQKEVMQLRDKRTKNMNEILTGIRVIKFFAWERNFSKRITEIRDAELKVLRSSLMLRALTVLIWSTTPVVVSLATFAIYVVTGGEMTAEKAFTSLAIFNILRFPLNMFPMVVQSLVEARVSMKRISDFLLAEEYDPDSITRLQDSPVGAAVEIKNANFQWDEKAATPTLSDVNLKIPKGKLVAIVGAVGSGKSSLLSAILGDLPKSNGTLSTTGSLAYAAQQPWMQNASLRENILFGHQYDPELYDQVLKVCELNPDIAILPDGDQTEIGEKGINLSGGQKQRVSLARSVYQDSDLYLLDDCLSAVDAHVGQNIFQNCIKGMLKNKTRLLVTHQLQFVSYCDLVIVLKNGSIAEMGTYEELMTANNEFASLIRTHVKKTEEEEVQKEKEKESEETESSSKSKEKKSTNENKGKLISAEDREVGQVTWGVWRSYIASFGGICAGILLLSTYTQEAGARVGSDFWLSYWSSNPGRSLGFYLGVYTGLSAFIGLVVFLRAILLNLFGLRSSKTLHEQMIEKVMRAPMSYFDTTPIGRILNRFTKDMNTIDESLTRSLGMLLQMLFSALSVLVTIGIITPFFLTSLLPLGFVYRYIQKYYLSSSRELKRLDSISKSPVYAQFSETLSGLNTIRPYNRELDFIDRNNEKLDLNQRASYALLVSNRWVGIRVESLGTVVVTLAAAFAVIAKNNVAAGFAGLSISYALQMTGILNWLVRQATEAETQMVSVERVLSYTKLSTEAAAIVPENRPPVDWPARGVIEFKDVQLRYREGLDLVLRGVSFSVKSKEKIGVVGRTGAGKSSLMLALFRLVELAGGKILIDGLDIAKFGLEDLRCKLSIIPQDPTLFTGTIRSNLDPFNRYSDRDIWQALADCHLKSAVEALPDKIESKVSEFGENFSVGQRQLMCLGRAILCRAKILIMDEATAAVDFETDALIQKTIREQFKDVTVLTIAHRINTILDYDRILVLDRGKVAEYESPQVLGNDPKSIFYSLLNKSGHKTESEDLLSPTPERFGI